MYTYNYTTNGGSLDASMYVANDHATDGVDGGYYYTVGGLQGIDLYVQSGAGGLASDQSDPGPVFDTGAVVAPGNGQGGQLGLRVQRR